MVRGHQQTYPVLPTLGRDLVVDWAQQATSRVGPNPEFDEATTRERYPGGWGSGQNQR